jgi:spermidine synthase
MQHLKSIKTAQTSDRESPMYIDSNDAAGGHWFVRERTIAAKQTAFQKAEIVELSGFGRALVLDGEIQSVEMDEYIYHEALVHPALCLHPSPRKVLVIGGGEGATVREILKHKSVEKVVMVDLDEEVIEMAIRHLESWHRGAFDDPRLQLIVSDGYEFVNATDQVFDVIIIDIVSSFDDGPAEALYTPEFYATVKRKLRPRGVLVIQAMECHAQIHEDHKRVRRNLAGLFAHMESYVVFVPSFWCMWGFIVATDAFDPLAAPSETIDYTIVERGLKDKLSFYDGITHHGLFALPKDLRALVEES